MAVRLAQIEGLPPGPAAAARQRAAWLLDWRSEHRNALLDCAGLPLPSGAASPLARDLLDVATAVYLADLAVPRGRNETWNRDLELLLPVREVDFWRRHEPVLASLLLRLSGDNFRCEFHPRSAEEEPPRPAAAGWVEADCVCLVSGGLDSAAAAAMLLRTGRHPRLVGHRSGNPVVAQAQDHLAESLQRHWPQEWRLSAVRLAPSSHRTGALPFPPAASRETSRRCRSLLFMALGAVAARAEGVSQVYLADNAVLTAAVPLSEARAGSFTTHSTHPAALMEFNHLLAAADWEVQVVNPFIYQAKGELIRTCLSPVLSPAEIQRTVSCWMAGRRQHQCGGCLPCLLRRVALLSAELPDEVYEQDVLGHPQSVAGSEAHRNLVDLLGWANRVLSTPEPHLPLLYPSLLEMHEGGARLVDMARALRRQATEVFQVVHQHFPAAAALMESLP